MTPGSRLPELPQENRSAFGNLRKAKAEAGFVSNFIDTAFNGNLFMWDSTFIVMFGKYASRIFDFQRTLDSGTASCSILLEMLR